MQTQQFAESLAQIERHWEARRQRGHAPPGFTIALARQAGTPAAAVARALAQRLGWTIYDRELLEKIAQEMGLHASLLETVDEKRVNWLLQSMENLLAVPQVNEFAFLRHLAKTVLALGMHGDCIIIGRGAAHLLAPEMTVRVRLVAPRVHRIARLAQKMGLSPELAAQRLDETDRERFEFVRQHFFVDPTQPENYDLVLNTEQLSADGCAEIILAALHQRQASHERL